MKNTSSSKLLKSYFKKYDERNFEVKEYKDYFIKIIESEWCKNDFTFISKDILIEWEGNDKNLTNLIRKLKIEKILYEK